MKDKPVQLEEDYELIINSYSHFYDLFSG